MEFQDAYEYNRFLYLGRHRDADGNFGIDIHCKGQALTVALTDEQLRDLANSILQRIGN